MATTGSEAARNRATAANPHFFVSKMSATGGSGDAMARSTADSRSAPHKSSAPSSFSGQSNGASGSNGSSGGNGSKKSHSSAHNRSDQLAKRRIRTKFTPAQIESLEASFEEARYPSSAQRQQLAKKLRLSDLCVQVWFQNRRARIKPSPTITALLQQSVHSMVSCAGFMTSPLAAATATTAMPPCLETARNSTGPFSLPAAHHRPITVAQTSDSGLTASAVISTVDSKYARPFTRERTPPKSIYARRHQHNHCQQQIQPQPQQHSPTAQASRPVSHRLSPCTQTVQLQGGDTRFLRSTLLTPESTTEGAKSTTTRPTSLTYKSSGRLSLSLSPGPVTPHANLMPISYQGTTMSSLAPSITPTGSVIAAAAAAPNAHMPQATWQVASPGALQPMPAAPTPQYVVIHPQTPAMTSPTIQQFPHVASPMIINAAQQQVTQHVLMPQAPHQQLAPQPVHGAYGGAYGAYSLPGYYIIQQ